MSERPDPDRVAEFVLKEDLVTTMENRGLIVRRPWWHPAPRARPGEHIALDDRAAVDLHDVLPRLAPYVASELRASGYAIPIPVEQQTLRDRYADLGTAGVVFTAVLAAVLVIAAIALTVWSLS